MPRFSQLPHPSLAQGASGLLGAGVTLHPQPRVDCPPQAAAEQPFPSRCKGQQAVGLVLGQAYPL